MKAVVQRVSSASVTINSAEKLQIGRGFVVLLGIGLNDTSRDCRTLSEKILNLRIFPNEEGKFSKSLMDVKSDILVVSQFTLYGDASKGRRPDFTGAARPEKAIPLYQEFLTLLKSSGLKVVTGEFAADMLVEIHNDGPVTIILDTEDLAR